MLPSSGTICEFVIAEIGTLVPGGMKKKKISLSRDLCASTLVCFYACIFKFSAITNSNIFPDEGSIAETLEFYLQLSAVN